MSFSEKQDNSFPYQKNEQKDNNDNTYIDENENHNNNKNQINIKKKNRTLQYYKFLFYTMKTEIKVHDFLKLLRNSNTAELSIWMISVVLFANIPKKFPVLKEGETDTTKYSGIFIWFHILHVIRAFLGMYLGYKLPRSYQIMDILQNLSEEKLEKTLFNDIIRETMLNQVIMVIKQKRLIIFSYFVSTLLNTIIDIIEFLYLLLRLARLSSNAKVVFLTYIFICIIYLVIDFSYIFWLGQLKYIFPYKYLRSINDIYHGIIGKAMITFKLRKRKTDIVTEAKAQKVNSSYKETSDMKNGGINLFEDIMKHSLGIYQNENNDKYLPDVNNQNNNNNNKRNIREEILNNNYPKSNEIFS